MTQAIAKAPSKVRTAFAPGIELTAMQRSFVVALTRNGTNPTQAARDAGYAHPDVAAYELSRLPHVQAAIAHERQRYVSGELANVATGTLRAIMEDKAAPAAARVSAARTVLEMAGEIGKGKKDAEDDRPLSEMSAEELGRLIDKWTEERAQLARPLAPGEVEIVDSAQAMAQLPAQTDPRP